MLEWAAISAAVLPHALEFAKGRAKSLAEKAADSALGDLYRRLVPDATLAAVNEAFFKRFCVELESSDFLTFTDDQTRHDLVQFLSNPSVQAAIQAPLDGQSSVDSRLSADFRWNLVAAGHQNAILQKGLSNGDLRPVYTKLAEIAEGIRQDQGVIPGFDASAYFRQLSKVQRPPAS